MLPTKTRQVEIQSTVKGQRVAMSIDQMAMQHIMNVLTDLYENRILACIREYSTNARDAMVEAGRSRFPIEVSTPTQLAPMLRIKDTGIGLSVDDITEIYSRYGASTKRDSNDFNGMLGLGCKAALAYTNQFTLVGIKDGVRCVVQVGRDEDGAGSMTVVDTATTSEPNGVEVIISAKVGDYEQFEQEAEKFFAYWDAGTVTLNGKSPQAFHERSVTVHLSDTLSLVKNRDTYVYESDLIVMGGVAYPAGLSSPNGYHYVAFVDMGAVAFTPSREALQDDDETRATILEIVRSAEGKLQRSIKEKVRTAPTAVEAIQTYNEWASLLPYRPMRFVWGDGRSAKRLPQSFKPDPVTVSQPDGSPVTRNGICIVPLATDKLSQNQWYKEHNITSFPHTIWVEGYTLAKFTPTHKKKLNEWARMDGSVAYANAKAASRYAVYALVPGKAPRDWVDPDMIVQWDDIAAIKLARPQSQGTTTTRLSGSYDLYENGSQRTGIAADAIDTSKPLYWVHGNVYEGGYMNRMLAKLMGTNSFTIVHLGANRIAKFERDFPLAKRASVRVKELHDTWVNKLTKSERLLLHMHDVGRLRSLEVLDHTRIKDPALKRQARLAKSSSNLDALLDKRSTFESLGCYTGLTDEAEENPLASYPLFSANQLHYHPDEMYLYLNASFEARKEA